MTDANSSGISHITLVGSNQNNSPIWTEDTGKAGRTHAWPPYGHGSTDHLSLGFNGERIDPVSHTYHLGNGYRAYNPALMRFNCPDSLSPFGPGGINPYAYCAGDPINHTDPSGHISVGAGIGIGLGVVGILGGAFALFTGGASIGVAGAIAAAVGLAADGTGIASALTEESNPQASATLGWVSLGLGIASGLVGMASLERGLRAPFFLKEAQLTSGSDTKSTVLFRGYSNGKITEENGFTSNLFGENKLAVVTHGDEQEFWISDEKKVPVSDFADFVTENFLIDHPNTKDEIHLLACNGSLHGQELADIWQRPVITYGDHGIWTNRSLKELASKKGYVKAPRFQWVDGDNPVFGRVQWLRKKAAPTRFDPKPRIMSSELRILEDGHIVI